MEVWKIVFHSILEIFHSIPFWYLPYSIPKFPFHSIPFFIPFHTMPSFKGINYNKNVLKFCNFKTGISLSFLRNPSCFCHIAFILEWYNLIFNIQYSFIVRLINRTIKILHNKPNKFDKLLNKEGNQKLFSLVNDSLTSCHSSMKITW